MKKLLLSYIPVSWQKEWNKLKNPGIIDEVDIAYNLLMKGDPHKIMFDVGAHVGGSTEPFARKGWKVYSFEPDPVNRKKLEDTCKRYPNVVIEPIALSDEEKAEMSFFSSPVSSGISSLLSFHESHQEAAKVVVTTLKSYCQKHNIQEISFLKTDTEGYDLPVLKGGDWQEIHPRVIVCEFDDYKTRQLGYTLLEQANFLEQQGYRNLISEWYPIKEYGKIHKWKRFVTNPLEVTGERVWGNIIAVKPADWNELLTIARKVGKIE